MTHRLVRGVAGATPQGARCVELRLKPQLKANLPRWSVPIGRTRLCRGAADAPVCSGRGWSHAPGGSVCRAAAEAAAQSELAAPVSAHREDEEEVDDGAAAQQTHRFVRGVAGATPQGARCVELRLKPQLGVAARSELASPTSSCLPTGRGRRCRSWRSCRLPRRLVPPVPPEPLAARPLVGLASGATHFKKRKVVLHNRS